MIFFKGDVDSYDHPRFRKAGRQAVANYWAAMAYTRKHELSGKVPREWFLTMFDGDAVLNAELLVTLVSVGLMSDDGGDDVEILNYAAKNETKEAIALRRSAEAKRKADYRSKNRGDSANVPRVPLDVPLPVPHGTACVRPDSDSDSDSDLKIWDQDPEIPAERTSDHTLEADLRASVEMLEPPPLRVVDNPETESSRRAKMLSWEAEKRSWYEAIVGKNKGGRYVMPLNQQGDLNTALGGFAVWSEGNEANKRPGTKIGGQFLNDWMEDYVGAFVRWLNKQDDKTIGFHSSFGPRGFALWMNRNEREREAKRVG